MDENGKASSTRVILLTCLAIFAGVVCAEIFMNASLNDNVYKIITSVFTFGLGGQAIRSSVKNARNNID